MGSSGCVAYSVSLSKWESSYCSMWDGSSFVGPGGDGVPNRACFVLPEQATLDERRGWHAHLRDHLEL